MDWPERAYPPNSIITPASPESLMVDLSSIGAVFGSAGTSGFWPAANRAMYFPFALSRHAIVKKVFWVNGSSVTGNVDLGVYAVDGRLIVSSGSTAQSGTNAPQVVDITDTMLAPGPYYIGLACSGSAAFMRVQPTAQFQRLFGCLEQSSAFPLPATATFAENSSLYVPLAGLMLGEVI
jgi:hypothetical protein